MVGLVIYIASFVIVIAIVASITTFFNNNVRTLSGSESISSEYNKFNLYLLEYTKNGYDIVRCSDDTSGEEQFITFSKEGKNDTFVKRGNILYFNQIKLCEKVDAFKIEKTTAENGKDLLKTYIKIGDTAYTTDYVVEAKRNNVLTDSLIDKISSIENLGKNLHSGSLENLYDSNEETYVNFGTYTGRFKINFKENVNINKINVFLIANPATICQATVYDGNSETTVVGNTSTTTESKDFVISVPINSGSYNSLIVYLQTPKSWTAIKKITLE